MTFKDGGAFDFQSTFEKVKDSALQAMENARESGRPLDLSNVHLDQLPAYEDINQSSRAPAAMPSLISPTPVRPTQSGNNTELAPAVGASMPSIQPDEPPPGYEETQSSSVSNSLEDSVRRSQS